MQRSKYRYFFSLNSNSEPDSSLDTPPPATRSSFEVNGKGTGAIFKLNGRAFLDKELPTTIKVAACKSLVRTVLILLSGSEALIIYVINMDELQKS